MKRVTKDPEERKAEIINTARMLFIKKGFAETKVSDIVKAIGVSQGIFYYYFKSKDEIIDEIINGYISELIENSIVVIENEKLSGVEKLKKMSDIQTEINMRESSNIHAIKGIDIHEKILRRLVVDYVPLMNRAFSKSENGDNLLIIEIFVAAGNVLFDPGIFQWGKKERNDRISHLINFMERSLHVPEGSFAFYKKLMGFIK